MVDTTWTNGGGDGKASTAANWSNGIDVGYNVIFDGTSTANCTFDYDGQLGNFTIAAGYSGTITQSSDMYISGYSQAGGIFTGVNSKNVYCSGSFIKVGGTVSNDKLNLYMIGDAGVISSTAGFGFNTLTISANVTIAASPWINNLYVDAGKTLTIASGSSPQWNAYSGKLYSNNGTIAGPGTFKVDLYTVNYTWTPGNIESTNLRLQLSSAAVASRKLTLAQDTEFAGNLTVISVHVSNTMTLDFNGYNLTASSITIGTRGILTNSAATDSIVSCATFDSSAGTFTEANTQVILNGNGTLKTAAGHKFDELVQRDNVITTLGSNITVTNEFDTAGSFVQGAYSITHENPEKRLIAPMVNPIIRNPKRSPFLNNRFTKNIEIEVV